MNNIIKCNFNHSIIQVNIIKFLYLCIIKYTIRNVLLNKTSIFNIDSNNLYLYIIYLSWHQNYQ